MNVGQVEMQIMFSYQEFSNKGYRYRYWSYSQELGTLKTHPHEIWDFTSRIYGAGAKKHRENRGKIAQKQETSSRGVAKIHFSAILSYFGPEAQTLPS